MASGTISNLGNVIGADWKVSSVNMTIGVQMTNTLTFPEVGIWLLIIRAPIVPTGIMLTTLETNNLSFIKSDYNVFYIKGDYDTYAIPVTVTAANATAYLKSASSTQAITFDYIERGGLIGIKIR